MRLAACICVKVLQLIFTIATFILKKLSDKHSERVATSNQKFLREWTLLNTISLTKETDEFSILTIMGFMFIAAVLLISRIIERKSNYHVCEIILLTFGLIFFTIQGLIIFGTVEQLEDSVSPFAYSLGGLSFVCAALFGIDLLCFKQMTEVKNAISQTVMAAQGETACVQRCNKTQAKTATISNKRLAYLRTDL